MQSRRWTVLTAVAAAAAADLRKVFFVFEPPETLHRVIATPSLTTAKPFSNSIISAPFTFRVIIIRAHFEHLVSNDIRTLRKQIVQFVVTVSLMLANASLARWIIVNACRRHWHSSLWFKCYFFRLFCWIRRHENKNYHFHGIETFHLWIDFLSLSLSLPLSSYLTSSFHWEDCSNDSCQAICTMMASKWAKTNHLNSCRFLRFSSLRNDSRKSDAKCSRLTSVITINDDNGNSIRDARLRKKKRNETSTEVDDISIFTGWRIKISAKYPKCVSFEHSAHTHTHNVTIHSATSTSNGIDKCQCGMREQATKKTKLWQNKSKGRRLRNG